MTTLIPPCVICLKPSSGLLFCADCRESYDETIGDGIGAIADAIMWAAARARRVAANPRADLPPAQRRAQVARRKSNGRRR